MCEHLDIIEKVIHNSLSHKAPFSKPPELYV